MPLITNSKNVHSANWDPDTGDMTIVFKSRAQYVYRNVERKIYEDLLTSYSPGRFLHKNVIKKFTTIRIEDLKA